MATTDEASPTDQDFFAIATIAGNHMAVKTLLNNGVSPVFIWAYGEPLGREIQNIEEVSHGWKFAGTPIHFAAYFGHYEIVHILLKHKPDIDNKNCIGLCDCKECAFADSPTAVTAAHIARTQGFHGIRQLLEN